jgi:hypothetical protein
VTGSWSAAVAKYNGIPLDEIANERPVTEGIVSSFGREPRNDALGASHMGARRKMRGALIGREGGPAKWPGYEKRMAIKSRIGRVIGWIRVR